MRIHGRSLTDGSVDAMIAVDLPGTIGPGKLPDEIQWAPPGRHTIEASRGGKPTKLDVIVNAAGAKRVADAHSKYLSGVESGTEDLPYLDFNHDDQEASAHPTKFYWGGDDPQRGGIRAKIDWTKRGREAVLGKTYRRFSPSFYVDNNNEISGAPVNFGGLVNRAAFKRIQPIIAKRTEMEVVAGPKSFIDKAKIVARTRNLGISDAIDVLAHECPGVYEEYRRGLGLGSSRERAKAIVNPFNAVVAAAERTEFMIESRALAAARDIEIVDAFVAVARNRPDLYEDYRANL
jgi:hypothetical protein